MRTLRLQDLRPLAALAALLICARIVAEWLGAHMPLDLGGAGLVLIWTVGHCDGMDGPVVTLAKRALETGNVNLEPRWVRVEDEAEIRSAFEYAVAVRKLGPQAHELAGRHFVETLVRVQRAGEGALHGLKLAGRKLGPAIPAADRALEDGSSDKVVAFLTEAVRKGVHEHYGACDTS